MERIVFLGDNRILRRVSIDFTVPDIGGIVVSPDGIRRLVYVPLSLLGKSVLQNFDLRDEAGGALSALGQREHNLIAMRMVRGVARAAVGEAQPLEPGLVDELDALVTPEPQEGEKIRSSWEERARGDRTGQRAAIWADPPARALMSDLSHLFILFVPMEVAPGTRRVIKFSFEEEFHGKRVGEPSVPRSARALPFELRYRREKPFPFELRRRTAGREGADGGRTGAEGVRRRVARSLLSDSRTFQFGVPIGGQAASCHVELPAPEDLLIASCHLERVSPKGRQEIDELHYATELAHLHPASQPRDALTILTVRFALRASGVLSVAALIAMLSSLMLLGGVLLHFLAGVPVRADAAGAVVVVAPAGSACSRCRWSLPASSRCAGGWPCAWSERLCSNASPGRADEPNTMRGVMPEDSVDTPAFLTFEDAVDHYLTEPVWYVGTAEGVLAPYEVTPEQARVLLASDRSLFDE